MADAITGDSGIWTVGENWPWPQVKFTDYYTLVFAMVSTKLHLFELYCTTSNVWVADDMQDLGTAATIDHVDVASFGMFYVISVVSIGTGPNSVTVDTFIRNPGTGTPLITQLPTSKAPECMTCCNFKGQAIMGGIVQDDANFGDLSLGWVAWSGIGNFDFRVGTDKTAGYAKVPWDKWGTGLVHKVKRLGDTVMVYGDGGRMALVPVSEPMVTFGVQELGGLGISSGNHIAGNEEIHCFIDTDSDLWLVDAKLKFQKLGYREYILDLTGDSSNLPVRVSYLPGRREFYICGGDRGFILNESGLAEMHQLATSVGEYRGTQCGFFLDSEDYEWRLTSDTIDLAQRGMKTIGFLELGINHYNSSSSLRDVYVSADYRYNYQVAQNSFSTLDFTRLNPEGGAFVNITAPEIRLKVKGTDYRNGSLNLDYIKMRSKLSDKRFVRGLYNVGKTSS